MSTTSAHSTGEKRITMTCDIESRQATPERRAVHHRACIRPTTCSCPAHEHDAQADR